MLNMKCVASLRTSSPLERNLLLEKRLSPRVIYDGNRTFRYSDPIASDELFRGEISQLFHHLIGLLHITKHGKVMDMETRRDTDGLSDIGLYSFQRLDTTYSKTIDQQRLVTVMSVNFSTMVMSLPSR